MAKGTLTSGFSDAAQVFNESSADVDFRIESNGQANMFFVDGGNDKIGIGTSTPVTDLTIDGTLTLKEQADADSDTAAYGQIWVDDAVPCALYFTTDAGNDVQITDGTALAGAFDTDAAQTFNDSGADVDFRIESNNNANTFFVDGGTDRVGIGTTTPVTDLTIEGPITIKEQADADSDTAAYGQIWVNTATPNQLYFTDDAGYDQKVAGGTAFRSHLHTTWAME